MEEKKVNYLDQNFFTNSKPLQIRTCSYRNSGCTEELTLLSDLFWQLQSLKHHLTLSGWGRAGGGYMQMC